MIKAVLFDYGGVITRGGPELGVPTRLGEALGISVQRAQTLLQGAWVEFMRGKLTAEQFWGIIAERSGKSVLPETWHIFSDWQYMRPDPQMTEFVAELKKSGLPVGLLSNVIAPTAEMLNSHGAYDMFDFHVLSYQEGYIKPQQEIYQAALKHLPGLQPSEIIFVDDQERCLLPAQQMGLQTVHAKTTENIIADVRQLIAKG